VIFFSAMSVVDAKPFAILIQFPVVTIFDSIRVIARSEATKQSGFPACCTMDCFASAFAR